MPLNKPPRNLRQKILFARNRAKRALECVAFWLLDSMNLNGPARQTNRAALLNMQLLGDYFLWRPYALACITQFRSEGKETILICNEAWRVLAEKDLGADHVIGINTSKLLKSFSYRKRVLRQLRSLGCSTAINFSVPRNAIVDDACIRALNANFSTGSQETYAERPRFDTKHHAKLYERLATTPQNSYRTDLYESIVAASGITVAIQPIRIANEPYHPELPQNPYFVLSPCASRPEKVWPRSQFSAVAKHILDKYPNLSCVLIGAPSEFNYIDCLQRELGNQAINLAGKNSLTQMRNCIRNSLAVLGNDSAAIHIAASYKVPSVAVMNGATFGQCLPYPETLPDHMKVCHPKLAFHQMDCFGCEGICRFAHKKIEPYRCLDKVDLELVKKLFEEAISERLMAADGPSNTILPR